MIFNRDKMKDLTKEQRLAGINDYGDDEWATPNKGDKK